jgi:hypothetical protein
MTDASVSQRRGRAAKRKRFSPPSPSVKRFRSCSFGQSLAAAIKVASIALPLENSMSRCLTNSMNTLDAKHRFRRI